VHAEAASGLVFTAGTDGQVRAWDVLTGREVLPPLRHNGLVGFARLQHFRKLVRTVLGPEAQVRDAETGRPAAPPMRHESDIVHAEFDGAGRSVLTADAEGVVCFRNARTGRTVGEPYRCPGGLKKAGFLDERVAFTVSGREACMWNPATG